MKRVRRPAVRIVCLDVAERVLLQCWRDPVDGVAKWGLPGGGIDDGETPLAAARRELVEETGFDPSAIIDRPQPVAYEREWKGRVFLGPEIFFLARLAVAAPEPDLSGFVESEAQEWVGHAWLTRAEIAAFTDWLDPAPADLLDAIARLTKITTL